MSYNSTNAARLPVLWIASRWPVVVRPFRPVRLVRWRFRIAPATRWNTATPEETT